MKFQSDNQEFCAIPFQELLKAANNCKIIVVGTLKVLFKHTRYIIELFEQKNIKIRCFRQYNQFEALHQLLKMKFKNYKFCMGEFPSQNQVFKREETRKEYFEQLLNKSISTYCENPENQTNVRLLSTVYSFLAKDIPYKQSIQTSFIRCQDQKNKFSSFQGSTSEKQHKKNPKKHSLNTDNTSEILSGSKKQLQFKQKKILLKKQLLQQKSQFQFQIKFQIQKQWKKRFVKVINSCLVLYKQKLENNFTSKIELYRVHINNYHRCKNWFDYFCQKMQLNNYPTFKENQQILSISHEYDNEKILIRKSSLTSLTKYKASKELECLKKDIQQASHRLKKLNNFEGVFSPVGKIFIILHDLQLNWQNQKSDETIIVKIRTSLFTYYSKNMVKKNEISIKQGFLIPMSSTFQNIIIELVIKKNQSWIREDCQQIVVGSHTLFFANYISKSPKQERQIVSLNLKSNSTEKKESKIKVSVDNFSHFSSIYSNSYANQNDGKFIYGLDIFENAVELDVTVSRVLCIFGIICAFVQAFWRNVYLFKYPRMGYTFFSSIIIIFLFFSLSNFFFLLGILLVFSIIYHHPKFNKPIIQLTQTYFFNKIHPNFKQPQVLSKSQINYFKWSNYFNDIKSMYRMNEQGRIQKIQKADKILKFPKHDKIHIIKQPSKGLFEKLQYLKKITQEVQRIISTFANTVEKSANLLTWKDSKRTMFVLILLLVFLLITSANFFSLIGILFSLHRIYKGQEFYHRKHYTKNKKIATFGLRYIINKSFTNLYKKNKIKTTQQDEVYQILSHIIFPVHDEVQSKQLKLDIEEVIGVYINIEELEQVYGKGQINFAHFINMIQSCESRLKVEWVPGQQGISNEFEELRQLTCESPVIDIWIQQLFINFILNVPSQLYTTFRPLDSQK